MLRVNDIIQQLGPVGPQLLDKLAKQDKAKAKAKAEGKDASSADSSESTSNGGEEQLQVLGLVPTEELEKHDDFYNYIREQNESIAARQIHALNRLKKYIEDPGLAPDDQAGIREQCLRFWGVTQWAKIGRAHV